MSVAPVSMRRSQIWNALLQLQSVFFFLHSAPKSSRRVAKRLQMRATGRILSGREKTKEKSRTGALIFLYRTVHDVEHSRPQHQRLLALACDTTGDDCLAQQIVWEQIRFERYSYVSSLFLIRTRRLILLIGSILKFRPHAQELIPPRDKYDLNAIAG